MAYRQLCLLGFVLGFVFEWGTGIGPLPTTGVWIGLEAAYLKAWCRIHLSVSEWCVAPRFSRNRAVVARSVR